MCLLFVVNDRSCTQAQALSLAYRGTIVAFPVSSSTLSALPLRALPHSARQRIFVASDSIAVVALLAAVSHTTTGAGWSWLHCLLLTRVSIVCCSFQLVLLSSSFEVTVIALSSLRGSLDSSLPKRHILAKSEIVKEELQHKYGTTEIEWQLAVPEAERGLVLLFHGCSHGASDWLHLPEERAIVSKLLGSGYSVLAFSSVDRQSRCWSAAWPLDEVEKVTSNPDVDSVLGALAVWLKREGKQQLPIFAQGASSGGTFVTVISRAMYLRGIVVMISPGHPLAIEQPPTWDPARHAQRVSDSASAGMPELNPASLSSPETLFNFPSSISFLYMTGDTQMGFRSCDYSE